MNIFFLSHDPAQAARDLCNKHVVKMIVETAQILSTVMWLRGSVGPYKMTHQFHPCVKWTEKSCDNSRWTFEHGIALLDEYKKRYKKTHACERVFRFIEHDWSTMWKVKGYWELHDRFVLCMPEKYKNMHDPVGSYKRYYVAEKSKFAKWEPRAHTPYWYTHMLAAGHDLPKYQ